MKKPLNKTNLRRANSSVGFLSFLKDQLFNFFYFSQFSEYKEAC